MDLHEDFKTQILSRWWTGKDTSSLRSSGQARTTPKMFLLFTSPSLYLFLTISRLITICHLFRPKKFLHSNFLCMKTSCTICMLLQSTLQIIGMTNVIRTILQLENIYREHGLP